MNITELTDNYQNSDAATGSDALNPLDTKAKISIDGLQYIVASTDETTCALRRVDRPRVYARFTYAELQDLIARDLLVQDREAFSSIELALQHDHEIQLWHLEDEIADRVVFQRYFCNQFLALELNGLAYRCDASMEVAVSHIYTDWLRHISELDSSHIRTGSSQPIDVFDCPKSRTVRSWLRTYEAGDFKAMALCPTQHKRIIWSR
ncbi:hypothetical protein [Roseibium sp.]|uniref:hypothetical protein n=1 Tax=Roseibium sp. TaxID=1936156 RepID=UPI003A972E3C